MAEFHFDNSKSFEENLKAFLYYMNSVDGELGNLLEARVVWLKGAVDENSRKATRTGFNNSIKKALDDKLAENKAKAGGSK